MKSIMPLEIAGVSPRQAAVNIIEHISGFAPEDKPQLGDDILGTIEDALSWCVLGGVDVDAILEQLAILLEPLIPQLRK